MNAEAIAAVVVPFSLLLVVIVPVLTSHQRKMAELIHSRRNDDNTQLQGRVAQLEQELREMKDRLNAAAIEGDRLRSLAREEHLNS